LNLATNGLNAGYYRSGDITFSSQAATLLNAGPATDHAAMGSRLALQVVSLSGPTGGSFQFWEGDLGSPGNQVTFSLPVGTTDGTNSIVLSENEGEPDADPYGHVHGRVFTATKPGLYVVGFRLIDISANGVGGTPIHAPSDLFEMYFQAGLVITGLASTPNGIEVTFGGQNGKTNSLEAADALPGNPWTTVAGPLRCANQMQTLTDTNALGTARYYRLRSP
jgi:hypothetical protein